MGGQCQFLGQERAIVTSTYLCECTTIFCKKIASE